MRFHVMSIPLSADPETPAGPEYERLVALACAAETHGFDGFWIAEHHFNRYGGIVPLAGVLLAHLAARTHTLRLGTAAAILPLRDPQTTVEEFAMVDALSGGRLELGVGRGFVAPEFAGRGVDMAERGPRFAAGLAAIEAYLSGSGPVGPRLDGDGSGPDLLPRPAQPRVPVWLAVSTSLDSCRHAGTAGHGLMLNPYNRSDDEVDAAIEAYLSAWQAAGHPDGTAPRILANQLMYAATSTAEAERHARPAVDSYLTGVQQSFKPTAGLSLTSHGFDDLYPGKLLVGPPELLREKVLDWQRRGVTDISVMSHFGSPVAAGADESLALFASEVLPHLAAAPEAAAVR
ncbi:LLM class flavin-dependent oxidoreductase [Actinoplanes sp. TFC3]|uniref:LLM class flavin-dependent oxidoreductase n=1 Tax=Actinoplanes sp. TFC3 TaxID=1710355 RepID=UPI0008299AA3|nr:LLM class flavin-dependent oxidoreductase [Actinoplanes sp. TFC3]